MYSALLELSDQGSVIPVGFEKTYSGSAVFPAGLYTSSLARMLKLSCTFTDCDHALWLKRQLKSTVALFGQVLCQSVHLSGGVWD